MYVESCTILVVVNHLSRPVVVLDGLPGLYGLKYNSATACGLPLYLYSYKLVGSATAGIRARFNVIVASVFKTKVFVFENPSLATNSYIIGIWNLKYANDHFPYAQIKDY